MTVYCVPSLMYGLCSTKWVKSDGLEYRKPCVLMVSVEDDDPVFARLEEIFVVSAEIYFKVAMQTTVRYSVHFHAYVIENTDLSRSMTFLTHFHFIL